MPIKSTYPDVQVQRTDIFSFLFNRKDRLFPEDKVIFQDADKPERQYTYADVKAKSIEFAKGLKAIYEFNKGDVLGLSPLTILTSPRSFRYALAGGVVSPANPGYTVDEFAYQLKDSGARVVAVHISCLDIAKKACAKAGVAESNIIIIGMERIQTTSSSTGRVLSIYRVQLDIALPKSTPKPI